MHNATPAAAVVPAAALVALVHQKPIAATAAAWYDQLSSLASSMASTHGSASRKEKKGKEIDVTWWSIQNFLCLKRGYVELLVH